MTTLFRSLEKLGRLEQERKADRAVAAAERLGNGRGKDGRGNGLSHREGAKGPRKLPSRDEGLLS